MASYLIISNNPAVARRFAGCPLRMVDGYLPVLIAARDAVHQGRRLLMHPESGSLKPGQTPYRSLLLTDGGEPLDIYSLELIERAIVRCRALSAPRPVRRPWTAKDLGDFQLIDLGLLRQALESIDAAACTGE